MNEMTKTVVIVIVAGVVGLLSFINRTRVQTPEEIASGPLFADFEDPLAATSLEIVEYDEELSEIQRFKVAQIDGVWSIPSHQGYPADAKDQVRDAATSLIGLEILRIASEVKTDHSTLGVVQPDKEQVQAGDTGVGTMVIMQDKNGDDLARVIIGKRVKGAEDQRFVRLTNQDPVYIVKINPEKLSTKFEDWIETDLLQLSEWDIEQIEIKDYSTQTELTLRGLAVAKDQRLQIKLSVENSNWKLDELLETRGEKKLAPTQLLSGEELNKSRLDEMKRGLDDLKIVDVERKPKGLRSDLRADKDFLDDSESLQSLVRRGFYPVPVEDSGQVELLCSDGEVIVRTKEGIEYLLRFGQVAGLEEDNDQEDSGGLNRYLFVTTRVWDEKVPAPTGGQPAAGPDDGTPAPESDAASDGDQPEEGNAEEGDNPSNEEKSEEKIEEDKKRKEQADKRREAQEKVDELNDRFAEWYYVISEEVFDRIRLGRVDLIQAKQDAEDEGVGIDSFRKLEEELEKEEEESPDST